ncbi:TRAP transporter large permease subunit [Candidatus Thioglobus sp.]|jgi:C4-dicarboxylate transporter DctM subunit|uniref:TRAP transporter large permease n=1 Tax=Candidatus Thioglobus sp. TaxID=2026721 RepID=UPI001D6B624E|nr:TRAP transporter large permease subunit [Candidatus Thioglobus sp.]MBT3277292.1 TRAP transporter large permease subunit [Candidatus Thioglobus sp.]MBT3446945.1 TRAP transporter large permease subunit [Candidatus Thioglobus sp.]MBT3744984.1 TRAP transporter large permease subunit [Candidatus Thioglobus sp.]MBT4000782.1 TRAP transporter large permease subunit [Candidatus Thioglobus sp.]MBT4181566.1 TRAP transporter large permease subunit [Candidatus Thioglobus sp.]
MIIFTLFFMLFGLMAMGVPVAFSLGLSSVTVIVLFGSESLASLAGHLFSAMEHYTLMAIPFFILASSFLSKGGSAQRLVDFAIASIGWIKGGLPMASVLACMMFAAISGSSPATVIAIGSIVIAGMVKEGYPQSYAAGVISSAGTMGILIPPSIVMVVYAAATEVSVGRMFLAGVIPGLIIGSMMMIAIYFTARVKGYPSVPFKGFKHFIKTLTKASGGLFLVVIIMGGIYGGIFTPTEAAAVAAVYAFILGVFVYRDIKISEISLVIRESAKTSIMLMFIIANAMLFSFVLTNERIPHEIAETIIAYGLPIWGFLLMVNLVLLIAGNFMEPSAVLLIMAPILFPIAMEMGIDPIHLGIMMVVNMEIGMLTPPVGLNLFVTSSITGMPLIKVIKATLPWLLLMLGFLMIITFIPSISTYLPTLLMGPETVGG